ncbi:MAG TPA: EAL domain-containing protein [Pseudomonadota bacterium]|nr:EAL domain-containing protein [Xanthomonadales bacterium]HQW80871.1 EAL domain-containing protein [Pseudomonadota bacterium]
MTGILVVERSATLHHLLTRTLQAAQAGSWSELSTYADTLDHLGRANDMGQPYGLLILGAPARMTRDFEDLLIYLRNPRVRKTAVLLLAHEKNQAIDSFIADRPDAQFLLWSNFSRIPTVIGQLLPNAGLTATAAVESSNPQLESAISLPAPTVDLASIGAAPTPSAPVEKLGIRVLFVDDSASIRLAYKQLLDRNGYDCDTAGTITEAFNKAAAGHYDLFIIDYFLPDGNGDELCRRLKALPATANGTIAIITGTYREDVIKRCLEAGAVECTFKNEAKELFLARMGGLARQIRLQKNAGNERQRLDGILGSVGDGVFGVDAQGVINFVNPTALRMLGHEDESALLGMNAQHAIHHSDEHGRALRDDESPMLQVYRSNESIARIETVFWNVEREAVPVECSVLPLDIGGRREGSMVVFRDIGERRTTDRMHWELIHDPLTGLFNGRHFAQLLAQDIARRREHGGYGALLYFDIDRYTHIVDAGGAAVGDRLVADFAEALGKRLREGDVLARLEGDRFALLLTGAQLDNLFTLADGFRELAHNCHYTVNQHRRHATVSLGVAVVSRDTPSAEYVLEHARVACKTAKHRGRDQTQIWVGEHDTRIARELEAGWTAKLRDAIEENRFEFDVQPIVPLAALPHSEAEITEHQGWRLGAPGHEILCELLLRMRDKRGEYVSPGVFVPLAERVGMMPKIDLWVVQHALSELGNRRDLFGRIAFNINLSNQTLADSESMALISNAIRASNVPPRMLVFEITETSEMTSMHTVRRFMNQLREIGCRFALDDFGTGFSSFTHLRHLPVDFVKIEGSFVEGMADNELDHTMVSSIAGLAKSMKLAVIGEHVDSYATLVALRLCGAEFAQGHWLGEPRRLAGLDLAALLPR